MKIFKNRKIILVFALILFLGGCNADRNILKINNIESVTLYAGENEYSVKKEKFKEIIGLLKKVNNNLITETRFSDENSEFRMTVKAGKTYEFLFNTLTYLKVDNKMYLVDSDLPKRIYMEAMGKKITNGMLTVNNDWVENNNNHIFSIKEPYITASFYYPDNITYTYLLNAETTEQFRVILNRMEYESMEIIDEMVYGGRPALKVWWMDSTDVTMNGEIGNEINIYFVGNDTIMMQYTLPTDTNYSLVIYKLKSHDFQQLYCNIFGENSINYVYDEYDCTKETDTERVSQITIETYTGIYTES